MVIYLDMLICLILYQFQLSGLCRSVNAAIAANSQHGPGPGIQSTPLYSPPGTSSPSVSSHLARHHELLHGGSLSSSALGSPTSSSAAAAVAAAISAASNPPPTSPLIVPLFLKLARPPRTYHCRMCDQVSCKSHSTPWLYLNGRFA